MNIAKIARFASEDWIAVQCIIILSSTKAQTESSYHYHQRPGQWARSSFITAALILEPADYGPGLAEPGHLSPEHRSIIISEFYGQHYQVRLFLLLHHHG